MVIIPLLEKLISFPSESGNEAVNNVMFEYCKSLLRDSHFNIESYKENGHCSLVAATSTSRKPKLLLQAHMDVVPAKATSYRLLEKDGKLYGRGVYDMKFAAACYLQLAEGLKEKLDQYDFGIMLTSDEEVGGADGVGMLLNKGYSADVCLLPDGGDNWQIESGCNGIWIVQVVAGGAAAHGSRPWEGENAIVKLMRALEEIQKLFGRQEAMKDSLTISQIKGGKAINQVADYAATTLDMRFVEKSNYEAKRKKIRALAKEHGLQLETVAQENNCVTDLKNPHIVKFMEIAEQIRGERIGKIHSLGASDARFFSRHDIPTILIRPKGGGAHSDNEWIDKASLLQFYEVLKEYVIQVAKKP